MGLTGPRIAIQSLSLLACLTLGRVGAGLGGKTIPCLSCLLVSGGCGGCVLRSLQFLLIFLAGQGSILGPQGLRLAATLSLALFLMTILGRAWCGWLCPVGVLQDALLFFGKRLGFGPAKPPKAYKAISSAAAYALLALLLAFPPLVEMGVIHPDLIYSFCQICPGGNLLPALAGQTRRLAFDAASPATASITSASLALTGMILGLGLAVSRPWCRLCPLTAGHRILRRFELLKVRSTPSKCVSCGNCERACPLGEPFTDKLDPPTDCLACGKCVSACPKKGCLQVVFCGRFILASS